MSEYLNPWQRQKVWDQRIREHPERCDICSELPEWDDRFDMECSEWLRLISCYNSAAPVVDEDQYPSESFYERLGLTRSEES